MKQIIEWSFVWENYEGTGWQHHLLCRTSEQEMIRFTNPKFKSLDDQLLATDLNGKQYQFDRSGFMSQDDPNRRFSRMSLDMTINWIRQYWTQGENDLFTYVGQDSSVDGDCCEFYDVTLKRAMGEHAEGTHFAIAKLFLSARGIHVELGNYSAKSDTFLVGWVVTSVTPT